MKILHVTECTSGGVVRAIQTAVNSATQEQHFFFGFESARAVLSGLSGAHEAPAGHALHVAAELSRYVADLGPDVIHAHSSWGGVWARVRPLKAPVIYQPHCYKFADVTISSAKRASFWLAEAILARRAAVTITLTDWERRAARKLGAPRVVIVPNSPTVSSPVEVEREEAWRRVVVMVGRICAQKDPQFFLDVATAVRASESDVVFRWVGDGDPVTRERMVSQGVEVSGWLDDDSALVRELAAADLYLHTALYEGFPLSVLDAARVGTPVIGRRIAAFEGTSLRTVDSVDEAAFAVRECLGVAAVSAEVLAATQAIEGQMWSSPYATALNDLYANVGGQS